jgi:hypothetical protein
MIYGESRIGGNQMAKKKQSIEDILEDIRASLDLLEDKINDIQDNNDSDEDSWDDEDDSDDSEDDE